MCCYTWKTDAFNDTFYKLSSYCDVFYHVLPFLTVIYVPDTKKVNLPVALFKGHL